jgi:iron complex transport system ATP-binding protein
LLLDEPTAGLDIVAMRRFLDTVRRLARNGTTIVLVTHHLHEIIPEIEHVVLLQEGRVARDGAKHEVLTGAHLSATYGVPLTVELDSAGYYSVDLRDHAEMVESL